VARSPFPRPLAVAAYGAVWLAENPETISFTWAGREYTTSLAVGAVAVLVLAMALSLVWAMVNAILRMPSRIGENSRRRKRERGLTALSRGIVAVGAATSRRHGATRTRRSAFSDISP
jgi:HemY protein